MSVASRLRSAGVAGVLCGLGLLAGSLSAPLSARANPVPTQQQPDPPRAEAELAVPAESLSPPEQQLDPNAALRIPVGAADGRSLEQVVLYLRNPHPDSESNKRLRQRLLNTFAIWAGDTFSQLIADSNLARVQRLPEVQQAEIRLYNSKQSGAVILVLLVTLQPLDESPQTSTTPVSGWLATGRSEQFPVLYKSDRTLIKAILNGGVGVFDDINPWFNQSPTFIAPGYQPEKSVAWLEGSLEPGLGAITQIATQPLYLYGAASWVVSGSLGADIFRNDNRIDAEGEKLYAGILYTDTERPLQLNLSAGRQSFQLNDGFLFSQFSGSANALERGATFLAPRTAYAFAALADLRYGDWRLQAFSLQPDELAVSSTETRYLGASLNYNNNRNVELAFTYVTVPHSNFVYALPDGQTSTRQGLQVLNPRLRLTSLFGIKGLWAESEFAWQMSNHLSMAAHGGYGRIGWIAENWPWRPSLSYRYALFSGDDPRTSTYERFDSLQASGLTDWLQGVNLGKLYTNSNSRSHRFSLAVQPSPVLSLSADYFIRTADQRNNLGGRPALASLQSFDIGQELLLIGRHTLSEHLLLQTVAGLAFPGKAIRQAVPGSPSTWLTLQLSLFMFF